MSSLVFNRLKGRAKLNCSCPTSPRPQGGAIPESARIASLGCLYTIIDNQVVPTNGPADPVSNATQPSSTTTAQQRDAVLTQSNNPYDPATRFSEFFQPPVPPPQFLQVAREQVSYEPYARVVPCIVVGIPKLPIVPFVLTSPDAPLLAGVPSDQSLILLWTIPAANGSPITDYEYTIDNGEHFHSLNTTKKYASIGGLLNGTVYNLYIHAVNRIGAGAPSNVLQLRPGRVPDTPAPFSAYAGNHLINLKWTIPYDGGSDIIRYEYTTDSKTYRPIIPYISTRANINLYSASMSYLENGTQYMISMRAVNDIGASLSTITWRATPHEDYNVIYISDIATENPPSLWTLSYDYEVQIGFQLTIDMGLTLLIPPNTTLTNKGIIIIDGTLTINGEFDNYGVVQNNTDGTVELQAIAIEDPPGTWTICGNYTIDPTQTLTVPVDTVLVLPVSYTLINLGTIMIDGLFEIYGDLVNSGSIINHGANVINLGDIATEYPPSVWTLNSDTTIPLGSILTIPALNNLIIPPTDTLLVLGQITIDGTLTNNGQLDNQGIILNNSNTIINNSTFTNNGSVVNVGTVVNNPRGTISSSGLFDNSSTTSILTNLGALVATTSTEVFNNNGNFDSTNGTQNWTTVSSVPVLNSAVGSNMTITLNWTAPTTNGGYAISDYLYTFDGITYTSLHTTGTTAVISALTNGHTYTVYIIAKNLMGNSPHSNSLTATPESVPTPPTAVLAVAGNRSIGLSWTAPTNNGGFPIIAYNYTTDSGITSLPLVVTGTTATITTTSSNLPLTNGTAYTVAILAQNIVGPSLYAAASPVTPLSVSAPPNLLSATGSNKTIILNWSAPTYTGGSPITDYSYTTDGGATYQSIGTTSTTNIIITAPSATPSVPFVNGTAYTISVAARNSVGLSLQSNSLTTTPALLPSAPTLVSATGGNARIVLVWSAPSSTGGDPITDYIYTTNGSTYLSLGTSGTTATITTLSTGGPLINGTGYTVLVAAVNAIGAGTSSNPLSAVPATVPTAPILTTIVGGNGTLTLTWTPPTSTGGTPITDYQYTTDGGQTYLNLGTIGITATINKTSYGALPLAALVNGNAYTVYIRAKNVIGTGAVSNFLTGIPVPTAPSIPTLNTAVGGPESIVLSWTAPSSNGGLPITDYEYNTSNSIAYLSLATTGTTATITTDSGGVNLIDGVAYFIVIRARNTVGAGLPSSPPVQATPITVPGVTTLTSAVGGNQSINLTWTGPTTDGGTPIIRYEYNTSNTRFYLPLTYTGTTTKTTTITTDSGGTVLANGTPYTVSVRAVNAIGPGPQTSLTATTT